MTSCGLLPAAYPLQTARLSRSGHIVSPLTRPRRCTVRLQPVRAMHMDPEQLATQLPGAVSSVAASLDRLLDTAACASLTLADTAAAVSADPTVQNAVEGAKEVAAADRNSGFFGIFSGTFEAMLKLIDSGLGSLNVPYSYGFSIILLTILIKLLTFPLTKKQVESTMAMQKVQPKIKEVQNRYKNDQERTQLEVARIYKENQINPLAGCLPTLATIPVFIGLYRALSNVAEEGLLTEGFFWIPSLGGPTTLAAQKAGGGFSWLLPFQDGAPPIGWHDALAYLSLPVLLVASQFVSQKIISPAQSQDPSQQSSQVLLKFLPFMIGYFALNVPSGLSLYWLTNNILSTGQQAWLKASANTASPDTTSATDSAERERLERVKKLTGQETGARRSGAQEGPVQVADFAEPKPSSRGKKRKGDKYRQLKAQEAARKAASGGNGAGPDATGASSEANQEEKQDA